MPCARCGTFIASPAELKLLDGRAYCASCAARPDFDYLETFRLKYWGKRDGWAWLIGIGSLTSLSYLAQNTMAGQYALAAGNVLSLTINVSFFLGLRFARYGFLAVLLLNTGIAMALAPSPGQAQVAFGANLLPLLIAVAIFFDTRNQLFFKVEIPRAKLQKAWDVYANNSVARAGMFLSFIGVFFVPFAAISLVLSIMGLRNVNPSSVPPIGRKGQAIAGIVISALSVVMWTAFLVITQLTKNQ